MKLWKWVISVPAFQFNVFLKVLYRGIKINIFLKDLTSVVMKINKNQFKQHVAEQSLISLYLGPGTFTTDSGYKTHRPGWQQSVSTELFHWPLLECHLNLQSYCLSGRKSVRLSPDRNVASPLLQAGLYGNGKHTYFNGF